MRALASILCLAALACAGGPPLADRPIDWRAADERWSVHIVTSDPGGSARATRIWLARVDGVGAIRTGDSRWWANLQRDPECRIRLEGVDYPVRVEIVSDRARRVRIDEAFASKYGFLERIMFPQERGETHENYALLRAVGAP